MIERPCGQRRSRLPPTPPPPLKMHSGGSSPGAAALGQSGSLEIGETAITCTSPPSTGSCSSGDGGGEKRDGSGAGSSCACAERAETVARATVTSSATSGEFRKISSPLAVVDSLP